MNETLLTILGAIGGSLLTSIIAPYLLQKSERRKYRGEALAALKTTEAERYYISPFDSEKKLYDSLAKLDTSLLIAGARKDLSSHYRHIAYVSYQLNMEPTARKTKQALIANALAQDTAESIVYCLWHPIRSRFIEKPDVKQLEELEEHVKKKYKKEIDKKFWDKRLLEG